MKPDALNTIDLKVERSMLYLRHQVSWGGAAPRAAYNLTQEIFLIMICGSYYVLYRSEKTSENIDFLCVLF